MRLHIIPLLLATAAGCDSAPSTTVQKQQEDNVAHADAGLTAKKVDDVWIFVGAAKPNTKSDDKVKLITTDALSGGRPTIENDCLLVDGEVVVWWSDQMDLAERIVGEAKKESPAEVSFPGGGSASDAPPLVADRCGAKKLRHAGKKI